MTQDAIRVLLVEDNSENAGFLTNAFSHTLAMQFEVTHTDGLSDADKLLGENKYHVMLISVRIIQEHGLEILNKLSTVDKSLAIVAITTVNDAFSMDALLKYGIKDFILSGHIEPNLLMRTVFAAIQHKAYLYSMQQRFKEESVLYDPITRLPNRELFLDRLERAIQVAKEKSNTIAVAFFNCDNLEEVCRDLSYQDINQLNKGIAERLKESAYHLNTVAKFSKTTFAILFHQSAKPWIIYKKIQGLMQVMMQPFMLAKRPITLTTNVSLVFYPEDGENHHVLLEKLDATLIEAQQKGFNQFELYNKRCQREIDLQLKLEKSLRKAWMQGEFEIYYQPHVDVKLGQTVVMEALIRWNNPERGIVPPEEFLPVMDEIGLMQPIGDWLLRAVCKQHNDWRNQGYRAVKMAVNVSESQIFHRDFPEKVKQVLEKSGLDPHWLVLEIKEAALLYHPQLAIEVVKQLKQLGVEVTIDDYGSSHSSIGFLRALHADSLKLDRSMMVDFDVNEKTANFAKAIIGMGINLHMHVVASGVEHIEQNQFLVSHGCTIMQGELFSAALPAAATKENQELIARNWLRKTEWSDLVSFDDMP